MLEGLTQGLVRRRESPPGRWHLIPKAQSRSALSLAARRRGPSLPSDSASRSRLVHTFSELNDPYGRCVHPAPFHGCGH